MGRRLLAVLMIISIYMGILGFESSALANEYKVDGIYLGIADYGNLRGVNKNNFVYRFNVNGGEQRFRIINSNFTVQNVLKEGEMYSLSVNNGLIVETNERQPICQGSVSMAIGDDIYVEGIRLKLTSNYKGYEVVNSAGGAAVLSKKIDVGNYVKIYDENTIYACSRSVDYSSPVKAVAGKRTLKNFIATALMPVGSVLYVYGGGWDWQDKGSSLQATSIGLSKSWAKFFQQQNSNYAYKISVASKSFYPTDAYNQYYYAGLDCSGYVGWTVYNTLNDQSGSEGFVCKSTSMAKMLADKNYGTWNSKGSAKDFKPGDIYSMNGHVWINLGKCNDGSMVILHSSPSPSRNGSLGGGVQLSAIGNNTDCEAYILASSYMKTYYPQWSERYAVMLKSFGEYVNFAGGSTGRFSWNLNETSILDPEGYKNMSANQILKDVFL